MHWYMINPVAKWLGVPTLVLRTGSAASLNGFIALPALYRKGVLPSQGEWQLDLPIEELRPLRVRDMISVGNDKDELLQFVNLDAENARASVEIIINTSRTIEVKEVEKLHQDLSLPIFAIGPLHKFTTTHDPPAIDQSGSLLVVRQNRPLCTEWLDTHPARSVLYVSFGSLAFMDSQGFHGDGMGAGKLRSALFMGRSTRIHRRHSARRAITTQRIRRRHVRKGHDS